MNFDKDFDKNKYIFYNKHMKILHLKSIVWKEGKFYVALNLDVDVSSFGRTKKQAIKNLQEALELYFEDTRPTKKNLVKAEKPQVIRHSLAYA